MEKIPKTKLIELINFVNWRDITYVAVIQLVLRFGFINVFNFETPLTNSLFFLLLSSILFMTLSGYLINSYYRYKQSKILVLSMIFLIVGILLGVFVSFKIQKPQNSLMLIAVSIIISLISVSLVNRSFIKTIAISMLMAFSLLVVWWYSEPIRLDSSKWELYMQLEVVVIIFSLLLFAGNLARAMIYSIKNRNIDKEKNKETFPIVFGVNKTKQSIFFIIMLTNVVIFAGLCAYATRLISYLIILPSHLIPQTFLLLKLKNAINEKDYQNVLKKLDFMLYTSIAFIPVIALLIKKYNS